MGISKSCLCIPVPRATRPRDQKGKRQVLGTRIAEVWNECHTGKEVRDVNCRRHKNSSFSGLYKTLVSLLFRLFFPLVFKCFIIFLLCFTSLEQDVTIGPAPPPPPGPNPGLPIPWHIVAWPLNLSDSWSPWFKHDGRYFASEQYYHTYCRKTYSFLYVTGRWSSEASTQTSIFLIMYPGLKLSIRILINMARRPQLWVQKKLNHLALIFDIKYIDQTRW